MPDVVRESGDFDNVSAQTQALGEVFRSVDPRAVASPGGGTMVRWSLAKKVRQFQIVLAAAVGRVAREEAVRFHGISGEGTTTPREERDRVAADIFATWGPGAVARALVAEWLRSLEAAEREPLGDGGPARDLHEVLRNRNYAVSWQFHTFAERWRDRMVPLGQELALRILEEMREEEAARKAGEAPVEQDAPSDGVGEA